ncbi:hypothetical protein [Stenotrophomonas sp. 364]|uniref:hypothetical protein n=1 Tax=Stenotrophomonas sp. 364 TaxID=2691571 RepID=UPI00131934C8|nr:hypothetical protein [Stenotrophomonas sp. 364]QHB73603.1 hypothetical protein GQ674_20940 [Stenotrophomonas sp. 364]
MRNTPLPLPTALKKASIAVEVDGGPAAAAPVERRSSSPVSRASPRIGDALSGAKTDADVAWLVRNGYPSTEAAGDALLRRGARGPFDRNELLDAAAILDAEQLALLDSARRRDAMEFLAASAQSGFIYALETIARTHGEGVNGVADPVRASAYRKADEMRGSWPAGLANGRSQLTPQKEMYATLIAHQVIANIERDRQKYGLPPLDIDTRPGLDDLMTDIGTGAAAGVPATSGIHGR